MPVDPKISMAAHAGHVKSKVNRLKKFMDENQSGLTARTEKKAEELMKEVTDTYARMETKWFTDFMDEVQSKSDAGALYTELSKKLEDAGKLADDIVADMTLPQHICWT